MRKMRKILTVFVLISYLSACVATTELWERSWYKETIKNFLISEDGGKIVILGKKYHYIFDDEMGSIKRILLWKNRTKLEMAVYDFDISSPNKIVGVISLSNVLDHNSTTQVVSHLNEDDKKFLSGSGFIKSKNQKGEEIFKKEIVLSGIRYLPDPLIDYGAHSSFNHEYDIKIKYGGFMDKTKKIAMTPLTVVVDGVIVAEWGALIIITLPFTVPQIIASCVNGNDPCDKTKKP